MLIIEQEVQFDTYQVRLCTVDGERSCHIKLLPYEGLLFSASLEELLAFGYLFDGNAKWPVHPAIMVKIKNWAADNEFEI